MGQTPTIEIYTDQWVDISSYVRYEDAINVTRGQQDEGSNSLDTSTCSLNLTNNDGRFSPRNPSSPYYGLLGRNTPLRVSVGSFGTPYLDLPGDKTGYASTPDSAALSITGDLDVRIEVYLRNWVANNDLIGKATVTGNQVSWGFYVKSDGTLQLWWSNDGSTLLHSTSTVAVPVPTSGRLALRATIDVNNGASGNTVTFYTSDSISGTWTQLGSAVVTSGTTSIFDSTAAVQVGRIPSFTFAGIDGKVFSAEIRSGIGGSVVANPDFTSQTVGDTSFTDGHSNTWTINDPASITDRTYRFWGEITKYTPGRDISGKDATVKVEASGITRRLSQGDATLHSSMTREFSNPARTHIIAYWPLEDETEATQAASALPNGTPAVITGSPTMGDFADWTATDPLPTMGTGTIKGVVPPYTGTDEISIRLFVFAASGSVTTETSLLHLSLNGGTISRVDVRIDSSGQLRTRAYSANGTSILDSTHAFAMFSLGFTILDLELSKNGTGVDWRTLIIDFTNTDTINDSIPQDADSGTLASQTLGTANAITVGRDGGLTSVVVGHLVMADDLTAYANTSGAIAAHNGEAPTARMSRLCTEEEIGLTIVGDTTSAVTMGDQLDKNLPDLMLEAAASEGGIVYEPRDALGFAFRTNRSMVSRAADLTLSCADHELTEALAPVDDDQQTLNDVTVKRVAGSSYRVEETAGPLSTDDPPDGVGRYSTSVDLSLEGDDQLPDQAQWRLNLGTVNEARFPSVKVHLYSNEFDDALRASALAVDVGARLVINDPSADLPPEAVDQLVIGYSEEFDQFEHVITYVCRPYAPWRVLTLNDDNFGRLQTGGSTLAADATSTATSLSVTSSGQVWSTAAGDLPFDVLVAGERVTVTAVSGTTSPQTFTVTRSVNGVVKAQTTGAVVELPSTSVIGL